MAVTRLILVRHAATENNLKKPYLLQGQRLDPPLAPLGSEQADAVANILAAAPVAAVFSSPLERALETAARIASRHSLAVTAADELSEIAMGPWEGRTWNEVEMLWPAESRRFRDDPTSGYLGGETFEQVRLRATAFLERICREQGGATVVAVSHNVVNRIVLCHWLAIPLVWARRIPQNNAGYNLVRWTGEGFRVETINAIAHLSERLRNE